MQIVIFNPGSMLLKKRLYKKLHFSDQRVSLYFYNTYDEIDQFVMVLKETIDFFTNIMG